MSPLALLDHALKLVRPGIGRGAGGINADGALLAEFQVAQEQHDRAIIRHDRLQHPAMNEKPHGVAAPGREHPAGEDEHEEQQAEESEEVVGAGDHLCAAW
jgi:hypothetical protein